MLTDAKRKADAKWQSKNMTNVAARVRRGVAETLNLPQSEMARRQMS